MQTVMQVTEPIDFRRDTEGGGLIFTVTSGERRFTFSVSRHKARGANHATTRLLEEADRETANVARLCRCGECGGHG